MLPTKVPRWGRASALAANLLQSPTRHSVRFFTQIPLRSVLWRVLCMRDRHHDETRSSKPGRRGFSCKREMLTNSSQNRALFVFLPCTVLPQHPRSFGQSTTRRIVLSRRRRWWEGVRAGKGTVRTAQVASTVRVWLYRPAPTSCRLWFWSRRPQSTQSAKTTSSSPHPHFGRNGWAG